MAHSLINDETSLFNFVVKEGNGVKGLVDMGIKEVPSRFIQPPEQQIFKKEEALSVESMTIDLSELDGPNHDQVVKAIVHASETLGFFQVVNHGVPLELLESLKGAAHQFFNQPVEKKAVYHKGVSPTPLVMYGSSFSPDNEKVLEWKDVVSMKYTNDADALEFWPNPCKLVALNYIKASKDMEKKILQVLIGNLGVKLDDTRFDELIGLRFVNINFYPVCPDPDLTVGVGRHSDAGMLTVLVQDSIGGLSVKKGENMIAGNEEWIEIPPIDGALVINVGDTLQILSNGRYKSGEHRVRTTNIESRVSIPMFSSPLPVVTIGPFPELVTRDGVARYREFLYEEYLNYYFTKSLDGKKALDLILSNGKHKSAEHRVRTTSIESRVSVPLFYDPLPVVKVGPFPELLVQEGVARYREVIYGDYMENSRDGIMSKK